MAFVKKQLQIFSVFTVYFTRIITLLTILCPSVHNTLNVVNEMNKIKFNFKGINYFSNFVKIINTRLVCSFFKHGYLVDF